MLNEGIKFSPPGKTFSEHSTDKIVHTIEPFRQPSEAISSISKYPLGEGVQLRYSSALK